MARLTEHGERMLRRLPEAFQEPLDALEAYERILAEIVDRCGAALDSEIESPMVLASLAGACAFARAAAAEVLAECARADRREAMLQ